MYTSKDNSSPPQLLDTYEAQFSFQPVVFVANKGFLTNGRPISIRGVNQHHDLGALGAAYNQHAAM